MPSSRSSPTSLSGRARDQRGADLHSADSRAAVDEITDQALAAGGRESGERQDHGFMYSRSFEDPDGHIWEPMFMDMDAFTAAASQNRSETADA